MNLLPIIKVAIVPKLGIFETNMTTKGNLVVNGGYESELLRMLLHRFGLSYELLVPEDREWGVEENGSWTGLFGMIERNEVDMAVSAIYLTEERARYIDCSYPYDSMEVTFVTRNSAEIHSPATFAYPFNLTLWISVLLSMLSFPFIFKFCFYQKISTGKLFFEVFGSLLRQPMPLKCSTFVNRLLFSSWEWFCFFIILCYSSVLLSFLTVPLKETRFKDLKSLSNGVRNSKLKVFLAEDDSLEPLMRTHSDPSVRLLEEYITKNNWHLKMEPKIIKHYMLNEVNAMIGSTIYLKYILGDGVFASEDALFTFPLTILMKKHSELAGRVNDFVHRLTASGIYKKNVKDYIFYKQKDLKSEGDVQESTKKITLDLEKLQGAFIILFIGLGLATCIFGIEAFHLKFKQTRKKYYDVLHVIGRRTLVMTDM